MKPSERMRIAYENRPNDESIILPRMAFEVLITVLDEQDARITALIKSKLTR